MKEIVLELVTRSIMHSPEFNSWKWEREYKYFAFCWNPRRKQHWDPLLYKCHYSCSRSIKPSSRVTFDLRRIDIFFFSMRQPESASWNYECGRYCFLELMNVLSNASVTLEISATSRDTKWRSRVLQTHLRSSWLRCAGTCALVPVPASMSVSLWR